MKRKILTCTVLVAVLLHIVSCNNEDEMSYEERRDAAITEILTTGMQPSEEGISLTAQSDFATEDDTRAAIYSTSAGYFETAKDQIGIMMLAKNIILESLDDYTKYAEYKPYNYLAVDWSSPGEERDANGIITRYADTWSVYLKNTPATAKYVIKTDAVTQEKDTVGTELQFSLPSNSSKNYYPLGAYHNYWFYGYAPRQADEKIIFESNKVIVRFDNLDGTQDVIRGYGEPNSDQYTEKHYREAYSAKYFRYKENRHKVEKQLSDGSIVTVEQAKPVPIHFEHKMMQLQFNIKGGGVSLNEDRGSIYKDYREAYDTQIMEIKVVNAPTVMEMILAEKDGKGDNKDNFYPAAESVRGKEYVLRNLARQNYDIDPSNPLYPGGKVFPQPTDPNATDPGNANNIPRETPVGDPLLLPVLKDLDANPYMINITLQYPKDSGIKHSLLIPMRLPVSSTKTQFEAGKIYNVTLTIYKPEEIRGSATLTPWQPVDETPFIFVEDGTFPIH